jgi:hypothetical protein
LRQPAYNLQGSSDAESHDRDSSLKMGRHYVS